MLREAYCTDAMKTFECQKAYEGQEDMKIDKKNGWPTNSVTYPTLTEKQVTPCSRKTEQIQRNRREVLN